jgi:type 1 glutamine amidotransferase
MKLNYTRILAGLLLLTLVGWTSFAADNPWVVYEGKEGIGKGKHIVFVTGDEEYRSEESMPQLAKILAERHGFKCTVLFAIDPKDGAINPNQSDNIPGLENLKSADLMVIFTRFRDLPDDQMKCILDYVNSGKPILGLRTATHAFNFKTYQTYAKYSYGSKEPGCEGGFGRQVLGETWIDHYGKHQVESTRGLIAKGMEKNPIVKGCEDIWGPSDVYAITKLQGDCQPVIMGQVLLGMNPTDKPNTQKDLVPVAWIKTYKGEQGKTSRVFATTMGHAGDLQSEGFRRLLVNAALWCLGMEDRIPERANVDLVGKYEPNPIGFDKAKKGVTPADHQ